MSEHSAEPWIAKRVHDRSPVFAVIEAGGSEIAELHGLPPYADGEGMANAWVMAAGPELLAACRKARKAMATNVYECGKPDTWATMLDDILAAAIATATGACPSCGLPRDAGYGDFGCERCGCGETDAT